ncbi:hypothetical protein L6452_08474 [Arctium lappa]|uniref:Uncharacterized protein n=1 Tax=Arctium lappa TaxID=4217 RepID=A0ACB9DHQ7_ARCLA|nr:hypothetical protein L6452_08474 [Arctium lappa]
MKKKSVPRLCQVSPLRHQGRDGAIRARLCQVLSLRHWGRDGTIRAEIVDITNSDFDAKPMVMLLGQYSTGKTTSIKHLLKSDYPGNSHFTACNLKPSAVILTCV